MEALPILHDRSLGALAAALDFRAGNLDFPTQPPSLEAYRLLRQGDDAHKRSEFEEALEYFQQAWAIDSTWMSPLVYMMLTVMDAHPAEADSVVRFVAAHAEHMSEPEHLMFQVLRSHFYKEDPTVKLRRVRRLAAISPTGGLRWAYWVAWQAYRPREALDYLTRVDTTSPAFKGFEPEYWRLVAAMHHALDNHEEELDAVRQGRARFPDDITLLARNLSALGTLGMTREIEALLDTVLAMPDTPARWQTLFVEHELRTHGFDEAARSIARRGLDWLETRPPEEVRQESTAYRLPRADLLYELGRWQEAHDIYEEIVDEFGGDLGVPGWEVLSSVGCTEARLGNVERAREISTELAGRIEEVQRSGLDVEGVAAATLVGGRARIAAVLGEREEAVRLLQEGFRLTRHKGAYVLEVGHWSADFELLNDYLPYQQFLKPRG